MIYSFPDNSKMIKIESLLLEILQIGITDKIYPNEQGYFIKWLRFYLDFAIRTVSGKMMPEVCLHLLK